ncbi:FkbM family methyltransferase [archaeon]|nr:FkbM family methyltransferase [archaeon]
MKKFLKKLIKKFGFSIQNIKKSRDNIFDELKKYHIKNESNILLLYNSYTYIKKIQSYKIGFSVVKENDNSLIVKIENYLFQVESVEDIFIISEVFIDKEYNFLIAEDVVLIDIGLNIGISSIFFSINNKVKHIYSYEPVPYTYEIACKNIIMNKIEKITANNFGLGRSNRDELFYFNKKFKGNSGIRKNNSFSINKLVADEKKEILVKIRDIGAEFETLRLKHSNSNIIMKIDCEGGEYEILNRMDELNLLIYVKLFMIEWHDNGPQSLEKILLEKNFQIISKNLETNSGMIYAFNKRN